MSQDETERKNHVSCGEHIPVSNGQCCWDASRLAAMHEADKVMTQLMNEEINHVFCDTDRIMVVEVDGRYFYDAKTVDAHTNKLWERWRTFIEDIEDKRLGEGKK